MDAGGDKDIEQLYRQVIDLGDRARGWFDGPGAAWRTELPVDAQAAVAIESLGTTARLIGVMAWLLHPAQATGQRPAFVLSDDITEFPAESPLSGLAGGDIALEARQLVAAVKAMASHGDGQA